MTVFEKLLQRRWKYQSAQSMVEFALVLPILLLIIFGIIGFGHLFFSYSMVVSASREAARYGAAVGLTDHFIPRYRDCDEIRQNAVRVGSVAGVQFSESSVRIQYDKGPKADGTDATPYPDECGAGKVGPGYIGLGDRIVVTVSVNYEPIVPLVNIPSFPLTAVTRRTIVVGMPVGDVPVAKSLCTGTITRIIPPSWETGSIESYSIVGQPISFDVEVISDDPKVNAQGTIYLYIDDESYTDATAQCTGPGPYLDCSATVRWHTVGTHMIRAKYDPGSYAGPPANPCFRSSRAEPLVHEVRAAETTTTILLHDPNPSMVDEEVIVTVQVATNAPGQGTPTGTVTIHEGEKTENTCVATLTESEPGIAVGSCILAMQRRHELNSIIARYDEAEYLGDLANQVPDFRYSEATVTHRVEEKVEPIPTIIASPTPTIPQVKPTSTNTVEPTSTLEPTPTIAEPIIEPPPPTATDTPEPEPEPDPTQTDQEPPPGEGTN